MPTDAPSLGDILCAALFVAWFFTLLLAPLLDRPHD